jgi:hypothetical protein
MRPWRLLGLLLLSACAATAPPPEPAAAPIALLPRWVERPDDPAFARVLATSAPIERTVRIVPAAERDPVDRLVDTRSGRRRLRSIALREAPVGETLRMFAELGRFNMVLGDDVGDRRVTLTLHDVSLVSALRAVLAAAHLDASVIGAEIVQVQPSSARRPFLAQ